MTEMNAFKEKFSHKYCITLKSCLIEMRFENI